jgi:hypothetical protein
MTKRVGNGGAKVGNPAVHFVSRNDKAEEPNSALYCSPNSSGAERIPKSDICSILESNLGVLRSTPILCSGGSAEG